MKPATPPPDKSHYHYDDIPDWWITLCPDNLDHNVCYYELAGRFTLGRPPVYDNGCGGYVPNVVIQMVVDLADLWHASKYKSENLNNPSYLEKCQTDQDWLKYKKFHVAQINRLPNDIEKKLIGYLEDYKSGLIKNCGEYKPKARYDDAEEYPPLSNETILNTMEIIDNSGLKFIHYAGIIDLGLIKAVMKNDNLNLRLDSDMRRFDYEGYVLDKKMNLHFQKGPDWLNNIGTDLACRRHWIELLIIDNSGWKDEIDRMLTTFLKNLPTFIILIDKGRDNGQHHYYEWKEIENIHVGTLIQKHQKKHSEKEKQQLIKYSQFFAGEMTKEEWKRWVKK